MSRLRLLSLLAVLALAAGLLLAACGDDDDDAAAGSTADTAADVCAKDTLQTKTAGTLTVATDSPAFEPYVVTGNSANQIRQSINQNRGMDYDAYTGWYLTWAFGDCDGNGLTVTVDVTYQFPEWEPSASASSELVTSWETYVDALFCHEYGHAKNGLDCANDVYTALAAIDAGGDCGKQQAEEGLQQLQLADAGNAAQGEAAIPEDESDQHREDRDIGEAEPRRAFDALPGARQRDQRDDAH